MDFSNIKAFAFDVDGVLTDGGIYAVVEDTTKRFTEGCYDAGQKITLRILRSVKASA